ncbi:sigma-70 family RNA polymerase sigma factor [Dokdonella sp.]|uniref:RNA polymerase sigma factor n=1 Tax=Dokdonella sp. TaxID=2291710 RepID=UPI001B2904CA|nr:sigma-70 family RNA polymerase sigma factor [Dokdonella sp.]MBO9662925.1 sigma-70 family RNA polymerase sigma factor [Dokdonella sp.]
MTARPFDTRSDDAALVAQSLAGSRDAFAHIVARYQSLICSIGYSATGNLSQSEDLAQETFISAWRQLRDLRDPGSLRAWLCGIARHVSQNTRRRDGREPSHAAEPIEATLDAPAAAPLPHEQAISDEEQAILWRSIAHIPPIYREPLVLFYREQQSIEAVGAALNLSEEAVKQRLSRGRRLLQEQIANFVEGALARSAPSTAFTLAVVAALPATSTSVAAAAIGATATQGSLLTKWAGFAALFQTLSGLLFGFAGSYLGYRMGLEATRTPRERALLRRQMRDIAFGLAFFLPALFAFTFAGPFWAAYPRLFLVAAIALPLTFGAWIVRTIVVSTRATARLREAERAAHPELFADGDASAARGFSEYRSKASLFGLPLLHVQFGVPPRGAGPACGWIAIGPARAVGVLYAMGPTSCGVISVGAISVGVVSIGSVSVGIVSLATIAVGWFALGGIALGDYALGGFAAAWSAAAGGLAVAHEIAGGGFAIAAHANDVVAGEFFRRYRFDQLLNLGLAAIVLLMGVPGIAYVRTLRKRRPSN